MKRFGANIFLYRTAETMLEKCLYLVIRLLISCFYRASLWLRQFLWGDHRLESFAQASLCVYSKKPFRNQGFLHELLKFDVLSGFDVERFLRKLFWFFRNIFPNFCFDTVELQGIINLSQYGSIDYTPVVLGNSMVTFQGKRGMGLLSISLLCSSYIRRWCIEIVVRQKKTNKKPYYFCVSQIN